jgi:hypothetical protein
VSPPRALFQHWVHAHEEDTEDVRVYHPRSHPFPPARGRRGLELREDGTFVRYGPGRGDRPTAGATGRWRAEGDNRIQVEDEHGQDTLDILFVDEQTLQVRRHSAGPDA